MSEVVNEFSISLRQVREYEFLVKFDAESIADLHTDETPPLGRNAGPSPTRMLAAAIGNCLSASLLFASRKSGVVISNLQTEARVQIVRGENRRLRIGGIQVTIDPRVSPEDLEKLKQPRGVFEDFCTVTQSVIAGIAVEVKVKGIDGE